MAVARINLVCVECGCEFSHRKEKFNRKEADAYAEWAKENINMCKTCYYASVRKAEEEKNAALIADKAIELAQLNGSEKQIAWAEKIRTKFVGEIIKKFENGVNPEFFVAVNLMDAAKWWIENRDNGMYGLIQKITENYTAKISK